MVFLEAQGCKIQFNRKNMERYMTLPECTCVNTGVQKSDGKVASDLWTPLYINPPHSASLYCRSPQGRLSVFHIPASAWLNQLFAR